MESPPSSFTWSEAFILSEDSGLLLTNSSISSGSMSTSMNGQNGARQNEFQDSDCEDKSFSQDDSLDGMSDIMCGENYNTLKKGVHWTESLKQSSPIEPPPEFQDKPQTFFMEIANWYAHSMSNKIICIAMNELRESYLRKLRLFNHLQRPIHFSTRHCWNSDFVTYSPCHLGRPNSRSSLGSSRLSSSHNSLSIPTAHKVDDSSFITQAVSHDTLSSNQISDLYNVPFDSDIYSLPIDVVKPTVKPRKNVQHRKKRRNTSYQYRELEVKNYSKKECMKIEKESNLNQKSKKRHSLAGTSTADGEPIHMTLEEVRHYLHTLYSSSSDSSDHKERLTKSQPPIILTNSNKYPTNTKVKTISVKELQCIDSSVMNDTGNNSNNRAKKNTFLINIKNKKVKDSCDNIGKELVISNTVDKKEEKKKRANPKFFSFKQALCNIFKFRRISSDHGDKKTYCSNDSLQGEGHNIVTRALPPLPSNKPSETLDEQHTLDFATSIQRVKDYGWYWGPISSEAAEKILSNEPDGSFIVRDSSDDHYIFSLTFKLNDYVRHVRIDHDQGNFSFGSCTKFKSQTIVEFIENAVEHSRSGRYLFFLHRRPVIGPVRVQLLHPVSRFKQIQSLQHMCRFVIHKVVRRDLIPDLPLPRRMIDYLNTPHYYSENLMDIEENVEEQQSEPLSEQSVQTDGATNEPGLPSNDYVVLDNDLGSNPQQPNHRP